MRLRCLPNLFDAGTFLRFVEGWDLIPAPFFFFIVFFFLFFTSIDVAFVCF